MNGVKSISTLQMISDLTSRVEARERLLRDVVSFGQSRSVEIPAILPVLTCWHIHAKLLMDVPYQPAGHTLLRPMFSRKLHHDLHKIVTNPALIHRLHWVWSEPRGRYHPARHVLLQRLLIVSCHSVCLLHFSDRGRHPLVSFPGLHRQTSSVSHLHQTLLWLDYSLTVMLSSILNKLVAASKALFKLLILLIVGSSTPAWRLSLTWPLIRSSP